MSDQYTRVPFFQQNPTAKALASKLTHGNGLSGNTAQYGTMDQFAPGMTELSSLARKTARSIQDSTAIFDTLPDTELTMQVVVSSVLSPNDMTRIDLEWKVPDCNLPSSVTGPMLKLLRDYFEEDYKIKRELPQIVEDALFKTGSYPIVIIPESSLDDLINTNNAISMESLKPHLDVNNTLKPKGFISGKATNPTTRKRGNVAIENYFNNWAPPAKNETSSIDPQLLIVDNYETLLLPKVLEKQRQQATASITRQDVYASLEAHLADSKNPEKQQKVSVSEFNSLFYKKNSQSGSMYTRIKTSAQTTRANIGHPMTMRIPSDSLIPIHIPGNPESHVAYFMLADEFGNPLSYSRNADVYEQFAQSRLDGADANSSVLKRIQAATGSTSSTGTQGGYVAQKLIEVYQKHVEDDLRERLRSGINGKNVEIAHVNDLYRIMFSRTLSKRQTQLVYIPAELVTYFAYDYTNMGIGRSLLDKSKTLASIRAILLFANTMAAVKNSVNHRELAIELDPDDPEPDVTVEKLVTEAMRAQDNAFPFTSTDPYDIVNGLRRAGMFVSVTGNTNYPETKVSVQDQATQRVEVSTDLDEVMQKRHTMSLGAVPELVNSSTDIEFAAELLAKNLLFRKQTSIKSQITGEKLTEFVTKYTLNDGKLLADLIKIVEDNRASLSEGFRDKTVIDDAKEAGIVRDRNDFDFGQATALQCIDEFITHLVVSLPQIDDTQLEQQMTQFKEYTDALDSVIPAFINRESIGMMMGDDAEGTVDGLVAVVKGYYVRRWLSNNNVMPELMELLGTNQIEEEPLDLLEQQTQFTAGLQTTLKALAERIKKQFAPKPEDGESTDDSGSSFGSDDDSGSTDTDTDTDDFGSDDSFDMSE